MNWVIEFMRSTLNYEIMTPTLGILVLYVWPCVHFKHFTLLIMCDILCLLEINFHSNIKKNNNLKADQEAPVEQRVCLCLCTPANPDVHLTETCFAIWPQSTALRTLAVVAANGVATVPLTASFIHFTFINIWKKRIKSPVLITDSPQNTAATSIEMTERSLVSFQRTLFAEFLHFYTVYFHLSHYGSGTCCLSKQKSFDVRYLPEVKNKLSLVGLLPVFKKQCIPSGK